MTKNEIPSLLREIQIKTGSTQAELAVTLGVTFAALNRWMNGKAEPRPAMHKKIRDLAAAGSDVRDPFALIRTWARASTVSDTPAAYHSSNRGTFSLRLKDASLLLGGAPQQNIPPALIEAIIGEIGNNAFDHNLGNWPDEPGVCFYLDLVARRFIIADRGQGILKTLQQVRPALASHEEALKVAFTEVVSGRAPEDRGNGLKFVRSIIGQYPIKFMFQSGNAGLDIGPASAELHFIKSDQPIRGCLAEVHY